MIISGPGKPTNTTCARRGTISVCLKVSFNEILDLVDLRVQVRELMLQKIKPSNMTGQSKYVQKLVSHVSISPSIADAYKSGNERSKVGNRF